MNDESIFKYIQQEADNELSNLETFSDEIREKIKSEYDRMIAEREEWFKSRNEEQS